MSDPQGVAVDAAGGLYVADSQNARVLYFPYDGATHRAATSPSAVYGQASFTSQATNCPEDEAYPNCATSLSNPWGVAVDGRGGLYVADTGNSRALYFPPSGSGGPAQTTATAVYGESGMSGLTPDEPDASASTLWVPQGVAVDGTGGLYVADSGNNRVVYYPYDASSGYARTTATVVYGQPSMMAWLPPTTSTNAGLLYDPSGVAADSSGGIYVADSNDNRVLHFP